MKKTSSMKKKGFTLLELIATIFFLSLFSGTMWHVFSEQAQKTAQKHDEMFAALERTGLAARVFRMKHGRLPNVLEVKALAKIHGSTITDRIDMSGNILLVENDSGGVYRTGTGIEMKLDLAISSSGTNTSIPSDPEPPSSGWSNTAVLPEKLTGTEYWTGTPVSMLDAPDGNVYFVLDSGVVAVHERNSRGDLEFRMLFGGDILENPTRLCLTIFDVLYVEDAAGYQVFERTKGLWTFRETRAK